MRIVIKVGTSTLAYPTGLLNIRRVEELCRVLSDLKNAGNEVVLIVGPGEVQVLAVVKHRGAGRADMHILGCDRYGCW